MEEWGRMWWVWFQVAEKWKDRKKNLRLNKMKKGKRGGKREEQSSSLLSGILLIEVKIKGRKWRNSQRSRERRDVLSRRALQKTCPLCTNKFFLCLLKIRYSIHESCYAILHN
jgi:hypothetical protein